MTAPRIVAVSDHPELAPLVAGWLVAAFHQRPGGWTVATMIDIILAPPQGAEATFVLFDGDQPAGTASLAREDLESRSDLTPWLAGVYVEPAFRLRGHASALVRRVEAFAAAAGVPTLWLYTSRAEGLYAGLGWMRAGTEWCGDGQVTLMRRDVF